MPEYICPPAVEIPDLGTVTCLEDAGQIQKLSFQRQFSAAGVKNSFTATGLGDIRLLASWDVFLAAADSTKVQVTPEVEAPTYEPGASREVGGGNASIGGVAKNKGSEATSATFMLSSYKQDFIEDMKDYQDELYLGVFLFNEYGNIGCLVDDHEAPTAYYPIPIARQTLFVGDKKIGGLEEFDSNMLSWKHVPNWSDKLVWIKPTDFNPLTDLVNV